MKVWVNPASYQNFYFLLRQMKNLATYYSQTLQRTLDIFICKAVYLAEQCYISNVNINFKVFHKCAEKKDTVPAY